ncbi:MAG: hypothetical protein NC350_04235 [Corallococcus sp.]|nr:hypothetical protein [Corallococcus sp.]
MYKLHRISASIILIVIVFAASLSLLFPQLVSAEETPEWVRVISDDTAFYTNAARTKITCYLEKTYYLKILSRNGDFLKAELMDNSDGFPKIIGYVAANQVEFCSKQPSAPYYPKKTVTVSANSAKIYFSALSSSEVIVTATNTHKMSYYGSIEQNGTLWYYVYYNDVFGYAESGKLTNPDIAPHPTPLDTPTVVPPSGKPDTTPTETDVSASAGEILLIVFVVVLAIGLTLTLFIPPNGKSRDEYGIDKRIR